MVYVDPYIKNAFRKNQPEGRGTFIRLDQNENPDGMPKWLFDKVMKDITPATLSMYPEEGPLVEKYARLIGLSKENVTLTDGSVTGMGYIFKVFGEPGKNLVVVDPTFNMYHAYAGLNGMKSVAIPYEDDFTFDINKMLDAIDDDTGIVVLVNPNMPIGNTYSEKDIEMVIEKAGKHGALVVVDEAYHYFYDGTSIPLIKKYNNLIVLRTFSKMLAITSLRLGVMISSEVLIHYINNWRPHYTISSVTLKFGEAIVDNHDRYVSELKSIFDEGKKYILKFANDNGYEVIPSSGCFICLKLKNRPIDYVATELKKKNILIFSGSGSLDGYVRLSICGKGYMERFANALLEIDK